MPSKPLLEIACFDLDAAIVAQRAGADRIELCVDYDSGGLSPSAEMIEAARKFIHIPLHVMIRPRKGDFVYSEMEVQWMIQYIVLCKLRGIDGVVLGALTKEKKIDREACSRLLEAAGSIKSGKPLALTFHRAIDECSDFKQAFMDLISLGFHRVLTSGTKQNALEGMEILKEVQSEFGKKIIVMPGGGIRSSNLKTLTETGCLEYHSSAMSRLGTINAKEIEMLRQCL